MKQISTGAGLLGLGVCMLATAFITTHRSGGEAFAQASGGDRRVVSEGVYASSPSSATTSGATSHFAYRIWSDNAVDLRCLGNSITYTSGNGSSAQFLAPETGNWLSWRTVDNGTSGFRPLTDVDMSGEVDGGDMSAVLMDWNQRSDDLPPPPIDCTINAPR